MKEMNPPGTYDEHLCADAQARSPERRVSGAGAIPTTCIETIGGDPDTAIRLSFQIKVF